MRKFSENLEEYSDLTFEQQELKVEVDAIIEGFEKKSKELQKEIKEEIQSFIFKMESEDFSPLKYTLGRRLLGLEEDDSTIAFDTDNKDIYNFIKSLEDGPEKIKKLFGMMSKFANSFKLQSEADSFIEKIEKFKNDLNEDNIDLNKYVYGEILLHPTKDRTTLDTSSSNYVAYDEDGKIEKKIREIYKERIV